MADIRLRHGWIAVVFWAVLIVGAGLMTAQDPGLVRLGIALVVGPLVLAIALLGLFYWKSRRQA